MIDVDVLRRSWSPNGDRLIARALDALAQVGVEVLVVAKAAAIARLGAPPRSFRTIAISDDAQLLAALGPEDRGLTFICEPGSVHGVLPGEISMRAVLWWLVNLRAAAGMARGQT